MSMPKGRVLATPIDRVLTRVEQITESGCWIFMGATNDNGYGIVGKGGRGAGNDRAHRITYQYFIGDIPKGIFVCHHCDVPSCCNPHHLFLGTNQDNVRDMRNKGRGSNPPRNPHVVGELHPNSKFTEADIREMRKLRSEGQTCVQIAKIYSTNDATVWKIVNRQKWRHVL